MGHRQKNFLDECVGLARSFSHVHWFIELAFLADAVPRQAVLAIIVCII